MRAILKGLLLALFVCVLPVACGPEEPGSSGEPGPEVRLLRADTQRIQSPDVTEEQVAELVRGNNAFAFDLYRVKGGDGNMIFSPYSISLAFSMAYAGARGETETQMAGTLNYLPQQTQHAAFNALEQRMSGLGEKDGGDASPFQLSVANAAWGQQGYHFEDAYLETLAGHYGAGLRAIDFGRSEEASEEINSWIANETENRIKDLVSPDIIDASTRLVLANAIYFKASWLSRFEEEQTQDGLFTTADGIEVTVPLMRQTTYLDYAEGDGYQAVRLPYKGDAVDMLVIVPEEGRFEQVEERLGAGFFDEVRGGLSEHYVRLTMPRFDFETDLNLPELLAAMGMKTPFDPGAADFSGMTGERELYISEALHRANITVDEKGTEAAAATVLAMPLSSVPEPVKMSADRPFIFAIAERETGEILFLGRVTDPKRRGL
jgi:serpin B